MTPASAAFSLWLLGATPARAGIPPVEGAPTTTARDTMQRLQDIMAPLSVSPNSTEPLTADERRRVGEARWYIDRLDRQIEAEKDRLDADGLQSLESLKAMTAAASRMLDADGMESGSRATILAVLQGPLSAGVNAFSSLSKAGSGAASA